MVHSAILGLLFLRASIGIVSHCSTLVTSIVGGVVGIRLHLGIVGNILTRHLIARARCLVDRTLHLVARALHLIVAIALVHLLTLVSRLISRTLLIVLLIVAARTEVASVLLRETILPLLVFHLLALALKNDRSIHHLLKACILNIGHHIVQSIVKSFQE